MMLIIGDVHGRYHTYIEILNQLKDVKTLQIGDMGYNYESLEKYVDPTIHKFITGNHDNHLTAYTIPHCLKRFGYFTYNKQKVFYVCGGFSIDWEIRKERYDLGVWPQTYFSNEELSELEQRQCYDLYNKIKPDILISHEPCRMIAQMLGSDMFLKSMGFDPKTFTTSTGELITDLIAAHKPKKAISGHMHKSLQTMIDNVEYISLAELEVYAI